MVAFKFRLVLIEMTPTCTTIIAGYKRVDTIWKGDKEKIDDANGNDTFADFHVRTVLHLDIIKVLFIHQLMHQ